MNKTTNALLLLLLFFTGAVQAQRYHTSLDIRILHQPSTATIEGNEVIYYELNVTNHSKERIELTSLEVLRSNDSTVVSHFQKQELNKQIRLIGGVKEKPIPPGGSAIIYLELEIPGNATAFDHRITYTLENDQVTYQVVGVHFELQNKNPVLGAPLKGGPWVAIYDPSWERGHRRFIYTINGKARIPGRFAIDFMKLDTDGQLHLNSKDSIKNWYGYSEEVLAVADGIVSSVINDFPESNTLSGHPRYTHKVAAGNYISIEIKDGVFAFYEHLKPGSITVKPGQEVKKGQVIGQLGFTGQSSGPHLHFHLANRDSPLGAEGLPFELEGFEHIGVYKNLDNLGKEKWVELEAKTLRKKERPGSNTVIFFK